MTSLGQLLEANIANEISKTTAPDRLVGAYFFEKAKKYFTDAILAAVPLSSLQLQIGGRNFTASADYDATAAADPERFVEHWDAFVSWAMSNKLHVYWILGRSGPEGYWFLRVEPATRS